LQFIEYSSAPLRFLGETVGVLFEESAAAIWLAGFSALDAFSLAHPAVVNMASGTKDARKTTKLKTLRHCDSNVDFRQMFFITKTCDELTLR